MKHADPLLVLAPHGRDTQVIIAQLASAGIIGFAAEPADIVAAIANCSLGAAIITDEAMADIDLAALATALATQPSWSDTPFLLLTRKISNRWWTPSLATETLGNVTMLERPLSHDALISATQSALRARDRQRKAEAYLLKCEAAEAEVRALAADLEARVERRTHALSTALADRAATEEKLRESEANYRFTIELTQQIAWSADSSGGIITAGQRWFDETGSSVSATVGDGWLSFAHPDDVADINAAWQKAVDTHGAFKCDFRVAYPDGNVRWHRSRAAPRLNAEGEVLRWYGTLENIDERRQAEARLAESQVELANVSRLSAMGTMASTLAHELNQPLTAIANYVRGSRRMLTDTNASAAVYDALLAADRSAVRAADIVRRVREFVESGEVQRAPENLGDLIRDALDLVRVDTRGTKIRYRLDLDPRVVDVLVDRIQIQQVLVNLLRNAMEALTPAGAPETADPGIVIATASRGTGQCEVMVRDNGPGVTAEIAARLFDTFNTSKATGMGMGLSICRTIIEAHGGRIWNRPGREGGTVFAFTLQVAMPPVLPRPLPARA